MDTNLILNFALLIYVAISELRNYHERKDLICHIKSRDMNEFTHHQVELKRVKIKEASDREDDNIVL